MEKKISELDSNTNLSNDDILVTVDTASTSTKKATVGEVVQAGLPQNISASVSIRNETNAQLSTLVLPIGELAHESDTNCIRIGDGSANGGVIPTATFYKIRPMSNYTRSSTQLLPDTVLSIDLNNTPGVFHVKSICMFSGVNPPKVSLSLNENAICLNPGYISVQRLVLNTDDPHESISGALIFLDERKSLICPNTLYQSSFDPWTYYNSQEGIFGYLVEMECHIGLSSNLEGTISIDWGCAIDNTEVSISGGSLVISKVG